MVDKTDKHYRVSPYAGSSTFLPMQHGGALAFGITDGAEAASAYRGIEHFDLRPNSNLHFVGVAMATSGFFVQPAGSDVQRVEELRNKRMPTAYFSGRTFHYYSNVVLATGALTIDGTKKGLIPGLGSITMAMAVLL